MKRFAAGIPPSFKAPPLVGIRPPRCPPFVEITQSDQLLPYLEHVARRPYNNGLNACWDLKAGERVLLRVDNWHSELVIEACKKILEKYKVKYEIKRIDRGPAKQWVGADEVEYYLFRTKELAEWMDWWEEEEKKAAYDKILMGYGGPVLAERLIKIQRMPFITPEILASPAHAMPIEVLNAIDRWTWDRVRTAKRVRITDPEGTDLSFTNHAEYYDSRREFYDPGLTSATWTTNEHFGKTYLPGHVTGRPWMFHPTKEDGCGVVAGTTNHIAPVDWTQLVIENSRVTQINAGGDFGDKLRDLMDRTKDLQYPTFPGKGIMWWWEASIGTNPHIHRPRKDFPSGFVNCLYERVRSGVIHIGFGTIISSMAERNAARMGHLVGHWHVHLYFPTYTVERGSGDNENSSRTAACWLSTIPPFAGSARSTAMPTCGSTNRGTLQSRASTCRATTGTTTPRTRFIGSRPSSRFAAATTRCSCAWSVPTTSTAPAGAPNGGRAAVAITAASTLLRCPATAAPSRTLMPRGRYSAPLPVRTTSSGALSRTSKAESH